MAVGEDVEMEVAVLPNRHVRILRATSFQLPATSQHFAGSSKLEAGSYQEFLHDTFNLDIGPCGGARGHAASGANHDHTRAQRRDTAGQTSRTRSSGSSVGGATRRVGVQRESIRT